MCKRVLGPAGPARRIAMPRTKFRDSMLNTVRRDVEPGSEAATLWRGTANRTRSVFANRSVARSRPPCAASAPAPSAALNANSANGLCLPKWYPFAAHLTACRRPESFFLHTLAVWRGPAHGWQHARQKCWRSSYCHRFVSKPGPSDGAGRQKTRTAAAFVVNLTRRPSVDRVGSPVTSPGV